MKNIILILFCSIMGLVSNAQNSETFLRNFNTDNGLYGKITFTIQTTASYNLIVKCNNISIEGINTSKRNYTNKDLADYGILFPINNAKGYFVVNGKTTVWVEELTEAGKEISGTGRYETAIFNGNEFVYSKSSGAISGTYAANYSKQIKDLIREANKNKNKNSWRETGKAWPKNSVYIRGINIDDHYGINDAIRNLERDKQNKEEFDNLISQANNTQIDQEKLNFLLKAKKYASNSQLNDLEYKISNIQKNIKEQKLKKEKERLAELEKKKEKLAEIEKDKKRNIEKKKLEKNTSKLTSSNNSKKKDNYKESPDIEGIERNHQENLKAINEKYRKIAYKSNIDHRNNLLDSELQSILNNNNLRAYDKQYALKDNYSKRSMLASRQYYDGQAERIKSQYQNNSTVGIATAVSNELQAYFEIKKQQDRRKYLRKVYLERVDFQTEYNQAVSSIEYLDDVTSKYLQSNGHFSNVKNNFKRALEEIEDVNDFDFKYRNEHTDIGGMFFNNTKQLETLFERLYIKHFSVVKNNLNEAIDLFLIEDYYLKYLSLNTQEYISDYIASELSALDNDLAYKTLINKQKLISRSFKTQQLYYSTLLDFQSKLQNKDFLDKTIQKSSNEMLTMSLLRAGANANYEPFFNKYKTNYNVQEFLKNSYGGKKVIVLEPNNSINKVFLARNLVSGLFGYVNNKSKWVIQDQFITAKPFLDSKAVVAKNKIGPDFDYYTINTIGKKDKLIKNTNILVLGTFSEGYAVATKNNGKLKGYIDQNFNWVYKPKYLKADNVKNGKANVKTLTGKTKSLKFK